MRKKIVEWLQRYVPAEIVAVSFAIVGASGTLYFTGNRILAAYAGAVGDIIGFYLFIFAREIYKNFENEEISSPFRRGMKTVRNVLVEFGPSEVVDNAIVRPFFMYILPLQVNNYEVGILIAKIAADSVYYVFAITFYELRKKYLH